MSQRLYQSAAAELRSQRAPKSKQRTRRLKTKSQQNSPGILTPTTQESYDSLFQSSNGYVSQNQSPASYDYWSNSSTPMTTHTPPSYFPHTYNAPSTSLFPSQFNSARAYKPHNENRSLHRNTLRENILKGGTRTASDNYVLPYRLTHRGVTIYTHPFSYEEIRRLNSIDQEFAKHRDSVGPPAFVADSFGTPSPQLGDINFNTYSETSNGTGWEEGDSSSGFPEDYMTMQQPHSSSQY